MTSQEIITTSISGVATYVGSRIALDRMSIGIDLGLMAAEGLGYIATLIGVLPPELGPVFIGMLAGSGVDAFHRSQTPSHGVRVL